MGGGQEEDRDSRRQEVVVEDLYPAVEIGGIVEACEILYRLFRQVDGTLGEVWIHSNARGRVEGWSVKPDPDLGMTVSIWFGEAFWKAKGEAVPGLASSASRSAAAQCCMMELMAPACTR